MKRNLAYMSGNEFVQKILAGERDFQNIRLEPAFNLRFHEAYQDLNNLLKFSGDWRNPFNISGSSFICLNAELDWRSTIGKNVLFYGAILKGSYFDYSKMHESCFEHANLDGVSFHNARLRQANFEYANLNRANFMRVRAFGASFGHANLSNAMFYRANLRHADFQDANLLAAGFDKVNLEDTTFNNANLSGAKITDVKNLEKAHGLDHAIYILTCVDSETKKILNKVCKPIKKLIVTG